LHRARSRLNAGARRRCAAVECSFGAGSAYAGAPDRPGVTSCPRCRVRSLDANTHKPSLWRHGDSLDRKYCTQNMGRAPHCTLLTPMKAHHSKSSSHTVSWAGHRACTRRSREPTCTQSGYDSRYALASWMCTLPTTLQSLRSWRTDQHDRSPLRGTMQSAGLLKSWMTHCLRLPHLKLTILSNLSATREAPPTSAPSMSVQATRA